MAEWTQLLESNKFLKENILDKHYNQYLQLFRYLDNENMHKVDLLIPSPSHAVSQDVTQFYDMFEKICKTMAELETLYQNKDLLKILKKIPDLV